MHGPNEAAAKFVSVFQIRIGSNALQIGIAAGLDAALRCTTVLGGEAGRFSKQPLTPGKL